MEIGSGMELKRLTKLIPENVVVSSGERIVGLMDEYLGDDE